MSERAERHIVREWSKNARERVRVALAKEGDTVAMRLCLERIAPPRRDRPVTFELPPIERAADAVKASAALMAAVAVGDLTPAETGELAKLVEGYVRAIQATEMLERLQRLEAEREAAGR